MRTSFTAASVRYRFGSLHHERAAERAERPGRFGLDGVLAIRIIGTAVEDAEATAAFGHPALLAYGTRDVGCRFGAFAFLDEFAFRIVVACDEFPEFPVALDQLAVLALRARFAGLLGRLDDLAFCGERAVALGKFGTAEELAGTRELDDHG